MIFLEWTEANAVHVPELDEQHKKLFAIVNELHEAVSRGQGADMVGHSLEQLIDYTCYHFETEEGLLREAHYPLFFNHQEQHDRLKRQVLELQGKFQKGNFAISLPTLNMLRDWLMHHTTGTDRKYTPYLQKDLTDFTD